ncbi:hypothetical protein HYH03_012044 [Edaphochlamys debaryana]|uniref:Uncharacterized protein n=1 Tax=Edaphochlamys debaryana TaxID=47281 RepID=A0A835XTD9_9CHLO|nr:hypothetical protein HYH03_012044 [Edaphochlamys debaryana]|eukprot:KAG2489404.1 hypothetical protein HYH03_012044 [Edaphochlamys debaryana]
MGLLSCLSCLIPPSGGEVSESGEGVQHGAIAKGQPQKQKQQPQSCPLLNANLRPYHELRGAPGAGSVGASVGASVHRVDRSSSNARLSTTTTEAKKLRRLSTTVAGSESGAALQLQRLCDLLRAKLGVSFVCVDVFGSRRPCSATLAASGCAEDLVPLAVPRLHTPADAVELRVLLPPPPITNATGASQFSPASTTWSLLGNGNNNGHNGNGTASAAASFRVTPTSPNGVLPGSAATSPAHWGAWATASGAATTAAAAATPTTAAAVASPGLLHHAASERWSCHTIPAAFPTGDRGSLGGLFVPDRSSLPAGAHSSGGSPRCPAMPRTAAAAAPCLCSTSVESLPKHIRPLASADDTELRSFWVLPLVEPPPKPGSCLLAAAACSPPATPPPGTSPCRFAAATSPLPLMAAAAGLPPALSSPVYGGGGGGPAAGASVGPWSSGAPRPVMGVLYLMGTDELLFNLPRDVVDQFCRWLSDAIAEGCLSVLADLADGLEHAATPAAAAAALGAHLTQFFSHRTQGMAEVLAYPAFLPQDAPDRAVLMLPPAAAKLLAPPHSPPPPSHSGPGTGDTGAASQPVAGGTAVSVAAALSMTEAALGPGPSTAGPAVGLPGPGAGPVECVLRSADSLTCGPLSGAAPTTRPASSFGAGGDPDGDADAEAPQLMPFNLALADTLLHLALTSAGGSKGQSLRRQARQPRTSSGAGAESSVAERLSAAASHASDGGMTNGSAYGLSGYGSSTRPSGGGATRSSRTPVGAALRAAAEAKYGDLRVLPGEPRHVFAGVVRETRALQPAGAAGAVPQQQQPPPPPYGVGLYLSISESLRPEILREIQSSLDCMLLLLANVLTATFGSDEMRPAMDDLVRRAHAVQH